MITHFYKKVKGFLKKNDIFLTFLNSFILKIIYQGECLYIFTKKY